MLALTSATLEITNERQFTVSTAAEPERLRGLTVTPNYFPTLGISRSSADRSQLTPQVPPRC